jgi:hypothetical protein
MFEKYENSVLALSNYSVHYGIDSQDEKVFKEYLSLCKQKERRPLEQVLSLFNESYIDKTVYCLPLLTIDIKLRTTIVISLNKNINEDLEHNSPAIFGDNIDNNWVIESSRINKVKNNIDSEGFFKKALKVVKEKIFKEKEVEIEMNLILSNKVYFKSDEYENIIKNAWETNGFISISKKWQKIDSLILNSVEDVVIVDKD